MTTKADNYNLNLLLTIVIAVLILFLVFKDKISLSSFPTGQGQGLGQLQSDRSTHSQASAIQEKLKEFSSMEAQLEIEKVERLENDFLNDKTVASLKQETARLSLALEQLAAEANLSTEKIQQEQLLSELLMVQLESERSNALALVEQNTTAENTIGTLNAALQQEQDDALVMRHDKEKFSLDNNALTIELQLKKRALVRSTLEVKRLNEELSKKDRVIARKNIEITRKKSELSRIKQQFAKLDSSSTDL